MKTSHETGVRVGISCESKTIGSDLNEIIKYTCFRFRGRGCFNKTNIISVSLSMVIM